LTSFAVDTSSYIKIKIGFVVSGKVMDPLPTIVVLPMPLIAILGIWISFNLPNILPFT
jgi:hypothetical protein